MQTLHIPHPFVLENGTVLPELTIAYHTYGSRNEDNSNVVWVCHALTANSDVVNWWPGVVGDDGAVSPNNYFIVCANIIGSCYGSTGPHSINPETGTPYYASFPAITIRDMVKAHVLLRQHLGIHKIHLLMGGSMGGYQVLEWGLMEPDIIERIFVIGTSATESAWGIAIHTAQRLAIEADATWRESRHNAGQNGLKAARAIGMLTYRNYSSLVEKQSDGDTEKLDNYKAASYINYQGNKLAQRFNAQSYHLLTKSMDTHHLGRSRGGDVKKLLARIKQKTLVIAISSDLLCPPQEQQFIAAHIPGARYVEIDSTYGHDGFLVEKGKIAALLKAWICEPA